MNKRPEKLANVKQAVIMAVAHETVAYTIHALERMEERNILRAETIEILLKGYHEARKDAFKLEYNSWNYAIRGKTEDGRNIRLAVAIESPNVIVVTAIDLDEE